MADEAQDPQLRYSTVAIWLHWAIAALLTANLLLGFFYDSWGRSASAWLMFFHKSIGIAVLALTLARFLWRLSHRPPPPDSSLKPWEAKLARLVHSGFYVLLLALPLTGWMFSSSWGRPNPFFGLLDIPPLPVARSDGARTLFGELHGMLGLLAVALILLHVAGAAKHHLQGHRQLMARMTPRPRRRF